MATENGATSAACVLKGQSAMKNIDNLFSPNGGLFGRKQRHLFVALILLLVSGCAEHYTPDTYSDPYGFFSGIWHGFIFPYALFANIVSYLLSLFGIEILSNVQIIGRPNTGFFFYYIGFLFGLSAYDRGVRSR